MCQVYGPLLKVIIIVFHISVHILQIHIIQDHVIDYCSSTGSSLGRTNDQCVEAVHQTFNKRTVSSNYTVKGGYLLVISIVTFAPLPFPYPEKKK